MITTTELHPYHDFIETLRDSPMFAVPYFRLVQIVPAIEEGFRGYEERQAGSLCRRAPDCSSPLPSRERVDRIREGNSRLGRGSDIHCACRASSAALASRGLVLPPGVKGRESARMTPRLSSVHLPLTTQAPPRWLRAQRWPLRRRGRRLGPCLAFRRRLCRPALRRLSAPDRRRKSARPGPA